MTPWTRRLFIAAPVTLLIGVIVQKYGWKAHPDLAWSVARPVWTVAHVAMLAGDLALAVVLAVLWRHGRRAAGSVAERTGVDVVAAAGAVGAVAMAGQMVLDLITSSRADSRAGMGPISQSMHDLPGFGVFFYGVIPTLEMAAIAALLLQLAARHRVQWWPALLYLVGSLAIGTQVTWPMVLGGVAVVIALTGVSRPTARYVDGHGLRADRTGGGTPRPRAGVHRG